MSDAVQPIPPEREQPQPEADHLLEQLETASLEKRAKSAALRAVVEHDRHLSSLNSRIDVIQSKLDDREEELHKALPRIAELEQAERTARSGSGIVILGGAGGALLLTFASFASSEWVRYLLLGLGASASVFGILSEAISALFGWPKSRK